MNKPNYLNNIGVYKMKLNKIITKDAKGTSKPCYYIEFMDAAGRIVSTRLNRPFNDFDYSKTAKLLTIFKAMQIKKEHTTKKGEAGTIQALNEAAGKELVGFVSVSQFNGKNFFQVSDFLPETMAMFIEKGGSNAAPSGFDATLDAFDNSTTQEDEDTMPF